VRRVIPEEAGVLREVIGTVFAGDLGDEDAHAAWRDAHDALNTLLDRVWAADELRENFKRQLRLATADLREQRDACLGELERLRERQAPA
jgi:hypothetical protein